VSFVSVTRLHVRSRWLFPRFLFHTIRSARQACCSDGFVEGVVCRDAQGGAWTVTVWESEADMRAFRISGGHRAAMPKLLTLCDEASVAHWVSEDSVLPVMQEAYNRMKNSDRMSKVRWASAAQLTGRTVSDGVPRAALPLKAKKKLISNRPRT
jgi:hypothetical protein